MPAKELSPIEIYKLLPGTSCKECDEANCMAFAAKLVNREALLEECPPLLEPQYKQSYDQLWALLKPAVKAVEVGIGKHMVTLGGEYVLYRHEFTYFNEPAIAVDVSDEMTDEEFETRIHVLNDFAFDYIGMQLKLDMLSIRSSSGDPAKFADAVSKANDLTRKPLMLCSHDPKVLEKGLEVVADKRPLIYAATKDNWKDVAELALKYSCPVVASSPLDLDGLKSLALTLKAYGIDDIVLDPGTQSTQHMGSNLDTFTVLRLDAINEEEEGLGYPILGIPMMAWTVEEEDPVLNEWNEVVLAGTLITRFTDMLVIHGINGWAILPQVFLRSNLYTDPRKPVSVEAELVTIGEPDENSPVLLTTNFALTYYTVANDIENAKVDSYLLVVDSEGMSVESAVAGRKMTADTVAEAIKDSKVDEKVKHRNIIIPGRSARLSGEIQEASGWSVSVGPLDSSGIAKYVEEKWNPYPE
ncbi:MAG: acetyl-CoA decarbonylase/synthase complex subunit gamma [Candidatus Bathyarchaeota archaeon]|nr:acetyl-CoA decarbonylase/synthase complex subunit gamma [Candidatus Bathyarchaeota archaeon]